MIEKSDLLPVFRGHHLICLHFYNGEGYDADYIKHLSDTVAIAETGDVAICVGADCICKACPHLRNEACAYYDNAEDDIRCMDEAALELLSLTPGTAISWGKVRGKIGKIFHEWNRLYCKDCGWSSACEKNARFIKLLHLI